MGRVLPSRSRARRSSIPRQVSVDLGLGFPRQLKITHRYAESFDLTSTSGTVAYYNFKANGMYDPNTTGTGHQPLYFDELSGIYNHYMVVGSKITYTFGAMSATNGGARMAAFINDDNTQTPTNINNVVEQSSGSRVVVLPYGASYQPGPVTLYWSARKEFGATGLSKDSITGSPSADPVDQSQFTLALQADGAGTVTVGFTVVIEYIAIWFETKDISSS